MDAILRRFKVQNFRSIVDSNWIETENSTCLVGTNESGKTNLLVALWKLNPANEEPIIPLIDYPRKKYVDYKATNGEEIFVSGEFEFNEDIAEQLSEESGWYKELVRIVDVSRKYNGEYLFSFPYSDLQNIKSDDIKLLINNTITDYLDSEI